MPVCVCVPVCVCLSVCVCVCLCVCLYALLSVHLRASVCMGVSYQLTHLHAAHAGQTSGEVLRSDPDREQLRNTLITATAGATGVAVESLQALSTQAITELGLAVYARQKKNKAAQPTVS